MKFVRNTLLPIFIFFFLSQSIFSQNTDLINLDPDRCFLGGIIKIFGWVKPNSSGPAQVNLEFFKPRSGDSIKHIVTTRSNGEYEFFFNETHDEGIWRIEAWKAGTSIKAHASFEVSNTIFLKPLVTNLKQSGQTQKNTFSYFKGQIIHYPDFASKEEIIKGVDELLQTIDETEILLNQLESTIDQLDTLLRKSGNNLLEEAKRELRKVADKANKISAETQNVITEINEISESSKKEADWCYLWMSYYDLCDKLNNYNNYLANGLGDLAVNLAFAQASQGLDFSISLYLETCIHLIGLDVTKPPSLIGFANFMLGTISDLGKNIYEGLMTTCSYFTGEAEGEYYAELVHDDMPFFTMSYKLKSKIELAFEKRKPGDPAVYLKGKFSGQIIDPDCSITMAPFAQPDTIGPVWCLSATPLVSSRSFLLYLEGNAMDDRLELKLSGSARDFDLKARAFYVLLSSVAYNLPIPGTFEFPLQDAEWFFTRTTQLSNPKIEYLELPIKIEGKKSIIEKEFDRNIRLPETSKRVGVNIKMKLHFKLSSGQSQ